MNHEHLLVVEDDRAVARGLRYALEAEGFAVSWAATAAEALAVARTGAPQLILLDIRLPDGSGFDVCRQLRTAGHRQPIIMLTARDDELDRVLGLELGADDYVLKPYSLREVISRVRAQLRRAYGELAGGAAGGPSAGGPAGGGPVGGEQANAGQAAGGQASAGRLSFGETTVDLDRMTAERGGRRIELTAIEFRLLRHLLAHPGRPFTRDALIEAVWGYAGDDIGNDRTVDVHIRHLREKLEPDPGEPRWILTVRGVGYKFERP